MFLGYLYEMKIDIDIVKLYYYFTPFMCGRNMHVD